MGDSIENRLQKASKKHRAGKLDEAMEIYRRILRSDPKNHLVNTILGLLYSERGNVKMAQPLIKTAYDIDPNKPLLQVAMGNLQHLLGQSDVAIQHYLKAIELAPDMPQPHYYIGSILSQQNQNLEFAEEHLRTAIQIAPEMGDAYYVLANVLMQRGKQAEAIEYFHKAMQYNRAFDKESTHFMIAGLKGETIANPPREYVENVFDNYAATFEQHVVEQLGYTVPEALRAFIPAGMSFKNVLDLGCGTGLSGKAFRDISQHLVGIDVSSRMVEETAQKQIYDELHAEDANDFLERSAGSFDLFIAADVFIYVGALEKLFENVRRKATSGAYFLFSIESCDGEHFKLLPSLRYAHSNLYVKKLANDYGFVVSDSKPVNIRKHHEDWLTGEAFKLVAV